MRYCKISHYTYKKDIVVNQLLIDIPNEIDVSLDTNYIHITGLLGSIQLNRGKLDPTGLCDIYFSDKKIQLHTTNKLGNKTLSNIASLVQQSIDGVSRGHSVYLTIIGVGYRAENAGTSIKFKLGQSHDLSFPIADDIKIFCVKPTLLCIYGIDKHKVTQTAASIKSLKPVEVYKGKGIRYMDELVVLKEGKKK